MHMCTEAAPARIESPLRPALPVRSTAGLQGKLGGKQSTASRYRTLLTREQIGSGGRLLRGRSELWWWPRGAAYDRHQIPAHGPRSSANLETSYIAPCDD